MEIRGHILSRRGGKCFSTTPNRTKGLPKKINSLRSYAEMKHFSALMSKEQLTAVQAGTAILY